MITFVPEMFWTVVLESAGWGDRMTGALCASSVQKYEGIDPNPALRKGYTQILSDFERPTKPRTPT